MARKKTATKAPAISDKRGNIIVSGQENVSAESLIEQAHCAAQALARLHVHAQIGGKWEFHPDIHWNFTHKAKTAITFAN